MRVQIHSMKAGLAAQGRELFDAVSISEDPEGRYAVAELYANELFVALRVTGRDGDRIAGEYIDHFSYSDDVPMLLKFSVSWDCIPYGFCKLSLWAPEMASHFDGSFEKTVKRFYFDRALYEAKREELHGSSDSAED